MEVIDYVSVTDKTKVLAGTQRSEFTSCVAQSNRGQLTPACKPQRAFANGQPTFDFHSTDPGAGGVPAHHAGPISEGFLWSDEFLMC